MCRYGLLGYPLGHSFSKGYFGDRCRYDNFEYPTVEDFLAVKPSDLEGFNVTIPHKQSIMSFLDEVDISASEVGAVNCVQVLSGGAMKGYNTDIIGFEVSLREMLGGADVRALVLGTGGAARAVWWVLDKLGIEYTKVSRTGVINYDNLGREMVESHRLIINATPLGMAPDVDKKPAIDYCGVTKNHYLYDLVYNPSESSFLRMGRLCGARVKNGYEMLVLQAEGAASIWGIGEVGVE